MYNGLLSETLNAIFVLSGSFGIFLIIYGYIVDRIGEPWNPLEKALNIISPIVTLLEVIIVAISIYLPINKRPPLKVTVYVTTPLMIGGALLTLIYVIKKKWKISGYIILGFAILALSGSLIRLIVI